MGSYAQDGALRSHIADADFTASAQYRAVKRTSTGLALCGAADVGFYGVLQDDVPIGRYATAKVRDTSKMVAGAAVAAGAKLTTDASGRFVTAATGNTIVGRAREAAAAAGDLFAGEIFQAGGGLAP